MPRLGFLQIFPLLFGGSEEGQPGSKQINKFNEQILVYATWISNHTMSVGLRPLKGLDLGLVVNLEFGLGLGRVGIREGWAWRRSEGYC